MRLSHRVGFLPGGQFLEISKISIFHRYVVLQSSISPISSHAEAIAQPTRLHRFCMCDRFLAAGCGRTLVLTATLSTVIEMEAQKKTQTRIKHLNNTKACLAGDVLGNLWDGKRWSISAYLDMHTL